jgi:hypothetical protein
MAREAANAFQQLLFPLAHLNRVDGMVSRNLPKGLAAENASMATRALNSGL